MGTVRTLVVDDSVVVRRILSDVLGEVPWIEVVGTAHDGRAALEKIGALKPDLVTLDVEMPGLNGLDTLMALRRTNPRLPVLMVSTLTGPGAAATLEALARGATDYVTKPSQTSGMAAAQAHLREQLLPKIAALFHRSLPRTPAAQSLTQQLVAPSRPVRLAAAHGGPVDVVAIGVSTGGPNALAVVMPELPADLPVPVLIVQHMPPVFTRLLAERLGARCKLRVAEAAAGAVVEPGQVWIAPGDHHMEVQRAGTEVRLVTHQGPPENSCRPAVDVLFRSAAAVYGAGVLAVVLTGMGQDGSAGCVPIREGGGQVIVQDEATSVVWGMPGYVASRGLAEKILPIEQVGSEIVRRVAGGRTARGAGRVAGAAWGGP